MAGVVVVTDSTSSLTPEVADEAGVVVVPLQVIVDGTSRPEAFRSGPTALTPGQVAAALREGRAVSTSRPSPEAFSAAYAEAMSRGADAIVSIHLSGSISGTVDAAVVAGRSTSVPVTTVPAPAGSFEIGATSAATATNLNAALTAAEATTSPYGAQLTGVSSSVAGVTVTPAQASIDLSAATPAD
ncbi:MAG: DegV family protein, partial [Microlunatus sp.]|nr:DegV family protein [Microlunatus sp.]